MGFLIYIAIGYVAAVLFPVPWLSQAIINLWGKALGVVKVAEAVSNVTTTSTTTTN